MCMKPAKGILDLEETIIIRLVRTARAYIRHRSSQLDIIPRNSLRRSPAPFLPIPKTITYAESQIIKARLRHRVSVAVVCNISCIDYSIKMRPRHLWDHSSRTFITDGFEAFTGIVEVKTRSRWDMKYNDSTVGVSFFLIFGYTTLGKFGVAGVDNEPQKKLLPWAGIFPTHDTGVSSHTLRLFNREDELQWAPEVIHKVREIVLARVDDGWSLPTVCELGAFSIDDPLVSQGSTRFERKIRVLLSTGKEETSEGSIYRLLLTYE